MSVQYTDGSFSDNMPFDEAVEEFQDALNQGTARALFVGTKNELNQIKNKKQLENRISEIEERLKPLETAPIKSESIVIPTRDEMIMALRKTKDFK